MTSTRCVIRTSWSGWRPQDSFIEAGKGGGIGWPLADSIEHAIAREEKIVDAKTYHTIKEVKNPPRLLACRRRKTNLQCPALTAPEWT